LGGGRGNFQRLTDFDLVRIFQVVGLGDDRVLIGITVEMPADFGKIVSGLHGIALFALPYLDVIRRVKDATGAPVAASNAWIFRSLVPPLNTNPPAVASTDPQFGLVA
jgi:hypothetical protein